MHKKIMEKCSKKLMKDAKHYEKNASSTKSKVKKKHDHVEEKEAKGMKRGGGKVMKFAKGGSIDGCAQRGKTKLPRGGK